jgi:hypothetical protein
MALSIPTFYSILCTNVKTGDWETPSQISSWSFICNKNQLISLRILPCECEVRGHYKCKEMPVIPVDRVVAKKRQIGKNGGLRGEEQGVDVDN